MVGLDATMLQKLFRHFKRAMITVALAVIVLICIKLCLKIQN